VNGDRGCAREPINVAIAAMGVQAAVISRVERSAEAISTSGRRTCWYVSVFADDIRSADFVMTGPPQLGYQRPAGQLRQIALLDDGYDFADALWLWWTATPCS
jgi:hypothetical protein